MTGFERSFNLNSASRAFSNLVKLEKTLISANLFEKPALAFA